MTLLTQFITNEVCQSLDIFFAESKMSHKIFLRTVQQKSLDELLDFDESVDDRRELEGHPNHQKYPFFNNVLSRILG